MGENLETCKHNSIRGKFPVHLQCLVPSFLCTVHLDIHLGGDSSSHTDDYCNPQLLLGVFD